MSTSWRYQCIACSWLLLLLQLLRSVPPALAISDVEFNKFLPDDMCTVECDTRKHTLCTENNPPPECNYSTFEHYRINNFHTVNIKNFLIIGHNGLRDRIARHMNVSNMVQVHWDRNLEEMASNYALRCTPFEDDACAHLKTELKFVEIFKHFEGLLNGEKYIAMNRFCMEAQYLPRDFIEVTMRSWYFEKNKLKPPTTSKIPSVIQTVGILEGENNFTHLAYPLTYLMGCSFARYDDNFCIFCFYYPYYPTDNNTMTFEYGDAGHDCPSIFPLRDIFFPGICVGDYFGGGPTALHPSRVLMPAALLAGFWWKNLRLNIEHFCIQ